MRSSLFLTVSVQIHCANAFTPAFKVVSPSRFQGPSHIASLFAEGGPPQYNKFDAVLNQAEVLAKGTVMLHVDTTESIDYQPGHVLALEIEGDATTSDEGTDLWMRGPYTVSRADKNSFDVLIRVVGKKSEYFASAKDGSLLRFGGKFKVPILEGIQRHDTKRVVLISTGVGVGPCIGAIEKALEDETFPPIELNASYRTAEEIVYNDHLDELKAQNPGRFTWTPTISSETGRLSASVDNLQAVVSTVPLEVKDTHYHLIGNGEMVTEFKEGLSKAGVPAEKVTIEMYFNHKAPKNDVVVSRIASVISARTYAEVSS